jgi:hypothetical protein
VNTPEDAFTKLLGRQPSDKEKQDLLRTRDALDLKNNDAPWQLVMALGHYETLYSRFPALIKQAAAGLARAKSDREHGGTLLIYTSANGVERYRQGTPATADVYGGGCTTLGLAATSTHPRLAGVHHRGPHRGAAGIARVSGGSGTRVTGGSALTSLTRFPADCYYLERLGVEPHRIDAEG